MLNFGNAPDARDAMRAARMSETDIRNAYVIEQVAYAKVREVLEKLGVHIRRGDILPTIENRMAKMKISVMHDYDPMTIGTPDDQGGWFIKKDEMLVARVPHPTISADGTVKCEVKSFLGG